MAILGLILLISFLSPGYALAGNPEAPLDHRDKFFVSAPKGCFENSDINSDPFVKGGMVSVTVETAAIAIAESSEIPEVWIVSYNENFGLDTAKSVIRAYSGHCESKSEKFWIDQNKAVEIIKNEPIKQVVDLFYLGNDEVQEMQIIFNKDYEDRIEFVLKKYKFNAAE